MTYERVYAVWDIYDGVRTGIADLDGAPHYFASQFDESADDYSDNFRLYPVSAEFMQRAMRNWAIYREWERQFHSGQVPLATHPGHGGISAEYDELKAWLDNQVQSLQHCTERNSESFPAKKHYPVRCFVKLKRHGRPSRHRHPHRRLH